MRDSKGSSADDTVYRSFTAVVPDGLLASDITYIPIYQGFLFLA